MYANDPEMAARWQKETPKGEKLPKRVKKAYDAGVAAAFAHFKLAGEEVRLQIPRRQYHGYDEAWRNASRGQGAKVADSHAEPLEPQASPDTPAEALADVLQKLDSDPTQQNPDATRDPLDRETLWGAPSNMNARQNAVGVNSSMGQDPSVGTAF